MDQVKKKKKNRMNLYRMWANGRLVVVGSNANGNTVSYWKRWNGSDRVRTPVALLAGSIHSRTQAEIAADQPDHQ